jgi:hypothetical protein
MNPPHANVHRPDPQPGTAALRGPFKRACLRAAVALLAACVMSNAPAAAAATGGTKKKPAKPAAAAKAEAKAEEAKPAEIKKQEKPGHIGIEHEQSAYPAEGALRKYKLVVRHKAGDRFFETDPKLVSLSVSPAGATDVTVRLLTPTRIEADFWAPEGFKAGEVSVSVYDRDNPQLVAATSDVEKPKPGAENSDAAKAGKANAESAQPEITSTAIVFLQRAYGIGRLKIEGKNFGNYAPPPVAAEDYLLCFEPLARQALIDPLNDHPHAVVRQAIEDKRCDVLRQDPERFKRWVAWRESVERSVKVALVPRNTDLRIEQAKVLYIDDKLIDVYFEFNRFYRNSEPLRLASTTVTVRKGEPKKETKTDSREQMANGARPLGDAVMMKASGGTSAAEAPEAVTPSFVDERKTYIATKEVGTKQDENLEYRYTVLDSGSATRLFGKGVSDNFYVIQLSVTNKGQNKIAIPLASIQAEIEWAYGPADDRKDAKRDCLNTNGGAANQPAAAAAQNGGDGDGAGDGRKNIPASYQTDVRDEKDAAAKGAAKGSKQKGAAAEAGSAQVGEVSIPLQYKKTCEYYEEGPPTVAPLPLPAVTAFFDGDMKVNGRKAKFFNVADGLATLGSSLIPFFGPGLKDAHIAFTGGLVPGVRRSLGDLSSQQLQSLTALSWQGVEEVAAKGGSVEKFVFIQRGDQVFSPGFGERLRKTIKNIEGMEVVGYEVQQSEPKRATPAGQ